jgi:hypothetical protein
MSHHVLLTESYGSLLWAPEVPCLIVRFHGFVSLPQYQELMNRGLSLLVSQSQGRRPLAWVADTRQMSALSVDAQHWVATDWNPRAQAAGLRHLCFVYPENVFGHIAVQLHLAHAEARPDHGFQLSLHDTLSGAIQELRHSLRAPLRTPEEQL